MFILTGEEIDYCLGTKKSGDAERQISGLVYNNSFFVKAKHYELSELEDAIRDCRENFLDNEQIQIPTLMIKEENSVSIWTQDNSYQVIGVAPPKNPSVTNSRSRTSASINLQKIAEKMRGEEGVSIKTRRHKLKLYHHCFTGTEAVDWLIEKFKIPRNKAIILGKQLVRAKIIHHVKDDCDFEDEELYYRFYKDEEKKMWMDKII